MPLKLKCTQAKQSSISILQYTASQSKDHLKDLVMPVTGRNMSQSISQVKVYCQGQAEVHLNRGAREAAALRLQPAGGGFLHCAQQTTSQEQKSHWDWLEEGILQSWTSQIWEALLKELHCLLHLKSQPQLQPQSFSDYTDSATHWRIIFFRQWPVITLPAHPNLQFYSKKVKQKSRSYFKKHKPNR